MSGSARRVPVWLFAITAIPYGVSGGFSGITIGRILSLHGVEPLAIAGTVAVSLLPAALQLLLSPLVGMFVRRRTWLVLSSLVTALLVVAAMREPLPSHLVRFTALVFLGQLVIGLVSACNGSLMADHVPDEERGRAGGWLNAGNLGGAAVSAGAALWLAEKQPHEVVGYATAAMLFVPSLAALFIDEDAPARTGFVARFRVLLADVWATLRAREGWSGLLLCLSPVGTAAGTNLFSGIAAGYHASPRMVTWATGFASGLVQAVGTLVGGLLCDRMRRRNAYLLSGVLTALAALAMATAPLVPSTFAWGSLSYLFISGICYAAFTAYVLEIIGTGGASAATRYSLFVAAGNVAIAWVIAVDGVGADVWSRHVAPAAGPRGLLVTDAVLNLAGVFALAMLFRALFKPRET